MYYVNMEELSIWIILQVFYPYLILCIVLGCALGLKKTSVNLMDIVVVKKMTSFLFFFTFVFLLIFFLITVYGDDKNILLAIQNARHCILLLHEVIKNCRFSKLKMKEHIKWMNQMQLDIALVKL